MCIKIQISPNHSIRTFHYVIELSWAEIYVEDLLPYIISFTKHLQIVSVLLTWAQTFCNGLIL